jgi:glycosyltransferase 2 family protein
LSSEKITNSISQVYAGTKPGLSSRFGISRNSLRFMLGLLVSGACIFYLLISVEKDKVVDAFLLADPVFILLSFVVTFAGYLLRAYRWKFLFSDISLGFLTSYRALIIGFFMNNILPARMGEIVRAHTLGKVIGKSRTFVLATIAAERLADGVTISLIFGVLYYFSGHKLEGARGISYVALFFLFASICTILLLLARKRIFVFLENLDRSLDKSVFSYVLIRIQRFITGLEPLFKPSLLRKVVLLSALVWAIELAAYGLITHAFGKELSLPMLALFLAAVNFSSLIPAAPGGIGVIETFASVALAKVGVAHELALAMVVTQHLIQYIAVGIPGAYYAFFKSKKDTDDGK